ncbi:hypothetical protein L1987_12945 [Smallanthus sonchifolius]|uniref:Uncharacterized protein n=1 Tax=Smallanthus sonchifolius TaxID=185202 RepID=A0ACB9JHG6_9ASTR|nr:hypothetical protein L1987_12945 [Smallanthus sonchifolius]
MATYARSHGGDGGGRDPRRNSRRLPTDCESPSSKKVRGRDRNLDMLEAFAQNGNKPLPLELDPTHETYKFVDPNGLWFVRQITIALEKIPSHYIGWESIPREHQSTVFRNLHNYFDFESWSDMRRYNKVEPSA